MRKYSLLSLAVLFLFRPLFAKEDLLTQLASVNKEWVKQKDVAPFLNERLSPGNKTDRDWIAVHLMLVEKILRSRSLEFFSKTQVENRKKCLNELHAYWLAKSFPINDYVNYKTPVFIDRKGTHCAVGYLMMQSGRDDLARQIDKEQKFAYVAEIGVNGVKEWAAENGFTLDELAWIQPTYGGGGCTPACTPGTVRNVSCYGLSDGCCSPLIIGGIPPYTGEFYPGHDTTGVGSGQPCNLPAGDYTFRVTDANGTKTYYYYTITQPDSLFAVISTTPDDGSCNGTAAVHVHGGAAPYSHHLNGGTQIDSLVFNLCRGQYFDTITDFNGCITTDVISINSTITTGVKTGPGDMFFILPNPTKDFIQITGAENKNYSMKVLDASGRQMKTIAISNTIDVRSLAAGVYFINISDGQGTAFQKRFIKL